MQSKINAKAIELYNTYRDKAPVLEANIKSKRRAMLYCDYKVKKACERADFIEAVFYQEVKQELLNLKQREDDNKGYNHRYTY